MKITKNDVGRFAVTRGGDICKITAYSAPKRHVYASGWWYNNDGTFLNRSIDGDYDLIQWAAEHPKYKAVFTWPETDESK